ncbi:hypothetical protein [Dolichospermum phage Dfl-JY45]
MDLAEPVFVDVHGTLHDREAEILDWAAHMGYVEPRVIYRAWSFDDEFEEWRYSTHSSASEAEQETCELEGPDGQPAVESVATVAGTRRLAEWCAVPACQLLDATSWMVLPWIDVHAPDAVGPWWDDAYAPQCLSAPRGGVLPSRQASVRWVPATWSEAFDASEAGVAMRVLEAARANAVACC